MSQSSKGQENQDGPGSVGLRSGVGAVGVHDPPGGTVYGLFFHSTNMYSGAGNTAWKRILRSHGADILGKQDGQEKSKYTH